MNKNRMIQGNKNFLIGLDQIEGGKDLGQSLQQIIEIYGSLNPDAFRLKTVPIDEIDLTRELQDKINNFEPYDDKELKNKISNLETYKANKMDLHDYRRIDTEIHERDLSAEVIRKLNTVANGYDDTEIRNLINTLSTIKADKVQLNNYRPIDILIGRDDLDPELLSFLENFDTLDQAIDALRRTKADRTELTDYRHKLVAISKEDLDSELRNILDNIPAHSHDAILLAIENLNNNKADKSEVGLKASLEYVNETFRKLESKIGLNDLDDYLREVLDNLPNNFDLGVFIDHVNQQIQRLDNEKLSIESSQIFRKKTEFIKESDLDNAVRDKLNAIGEGYDDTELREAINRVESEKLDSASAAEIYRKKGVAIAEQDLTPELQIKINKDHDVEELRSRVTNVEESLDNKLEEKDLANYRRKDILIQEDDLSSEVRSKLNTLAQGYDDKPLWDKIDELEAEDERLQTDIDNKVDRLTLVKADKTELNSYRSKDDEIIESDLESSLVEKINKGASINLEPLETNISELQQEVERLESDKADRTTLNQYRAKTEFIKKVDLDPTLVRFIEDQTYDDTSLRNSLNSKLDSSVAESTYRKKTDKIAKVDLEQSVQDKLDLATNDHNNLINKNADEEYLHITRTEYDKFKSYETMIDNLLKRVTALENGVVRPSITKSSIDGLSKVGINIGVIEFTVDPYETILEDPEQNIIMTPENKITRCVIEEGKLKVYVSTLSQDTEYYITVKKEALCYKDRNAVSDYIKTFETEIVRTPPTLGHSTLHGQQNVSLTTDRIQLPITGDGTMSIADSSKIKMSPNKIAGIPSISGGKLNLPISRLVETTDYTVTIGTGAIKSSYNLVNAEFVDSFRTEDVLTKPVVGDSSLKDAVDVPITTSKIEFPVTVGERIVIVNQSLITVSPDVKKGNAVVEGNKLVINFNPLQQDTEYTVTIGAGALRDGDDLVTDVTTINTFLTETIVEEEPNLWEYEVELTGIENSFIKYSDIERAVGETVDPIYFLCDTEDDFMNDIYAENPPIVVEYMGTPAYPISGGVRVPRVGMDDGGECPEIPVPVHQPTGINFYTMGAVDVQDDKLQFEGGPVFLHKFRIRRVK